MFIFYQELLNHLLAWPTDMQFLYLPLNMYTPVDTCAEDATVIICSVYTCAYKNTLPSLLEVLHYTTLTWYHDRNTKWNNVQFLPRTVKSPVGVTDWLTDKINSFTPPLSIYTPVYTCMCWGGNSTHLLSISYCDEEAGREEQSSPTFDLWWCVSSVVYGYK